MNAADFDGICQRLPGAEMVIQWRGSRVYKIGGKVFAIGNEWGGALAYVFKTTPLTYEILLEQGIGTRAPYLPRGCWVQVAADALTGAELADYLGQSYRIVAARLTGAARAALGI